MSGFFFRWKYPNTSRKLDKFFIAILLMYIPTYYFLIAPTKTFIESKDLVQIHGTVQYLNFPRSSRDNIATLRLNEDSISYSFNMRGYYTSHKIKFGDSVTILALNNDLQKDLNEVRSYELLQGFKQIFTVNAYNTSLNDSRQIYKIFVWIAIFFIVLYVLIDKTKFIPKVKKLLDSPDPKFRPPSEEPNINEFLVKPYPKSGQFKIRHFCKFKLFNYEKENLHRVTDFVNSQAA